MGAVDGRGDEAVALNEKKAARVCLLGNSSGNEADSSVMARLTSLVSFLFASRRTFR